MTNKLITIAAMLAVMVAMTGTAAAYDLIINQGSPNQNSVEPDSVLLLPGVPHNVSLYGQEFEGAVPQSFPLNYIVECHHDNLLCNPADLEIVFNHVSGITDPFPSLGPIIDNNLSFLVKDAITITLNNTPTDPVGTKYNYFIIGGPGNTTGHSAEASRTVVRDIVGVPEYTSIVLPTVSIMGLVFLLSRRKQN
jgi:hypothetical protein